MLFGTCRDFWEDIVTMFLYSLWCFCPAGYKWMIAALAQLLNGQCSSCASPACLPLVRGSQCWGLEDNEVNEYTTESAVFLHWEHNEWKMLSLVKLISSEVGFGKRGFVCAWAPATRSLLAAGPLACTEVTWSMTQFPPALWGALLWGWLVWFETA